MPRRYDCPPQGRPRICRFWVQYDRSKQTQGPRRRCVFRRLVPMIGLIAAVGNGSLRSLRRGPRSISTRANRPRRCFHGDCGTCHKSAKGLANGRNAGRSQASCASTIRRAPSRQLRLRLTFLAPAPDLRLTANLKPGTGAAEQDRRSKARRGKVRRGKAGRQEGRPPGRPERRHGQAAAARPGRKDKAEASRC